MGQIDRAGHADDPGYMAMMEDAAGDGGAPEPPVWCAYVDTADGEVEGIVWGGGSTMDLAGSAGVSVVYATTEVKHLGDVEPGMHEVRAYRDPLWEEDDHGERVVDWEEERRMLVWLTPSRPVPWTPPRDVGVTP